MSMKFYLEATSKDIVPDEAFRIFLGLIPKNDTKAKMSKYFASLSQKELKELNEHYRKYTVKQAESNFPKLMGNKLLNHLFSTADTGFGPGEIFLTFVLKDITRLGGQSTPYDLEVGGKAYEVKKIDGPHVRLGVTGIFSTTEPSKQMSRTLDILEHLIHDLKIQKIKDIVDQSIGSVASKKEMDSLNYLSDKFHGGEIGDADFNAFEYIYQQLHKLEKTDLSGFSKVVFKGPNVKDKSINIKPVDHSVVAGDVIKIKKSDSSDETQEIWMQINSIKYVHKPDDFKNDLQKAVTKLTETKDFIVFRGGKMYVTKDIKFSRVTMGHIAITFKSKNEGKK